MGNNYNLIGLKLLFFSSIISKIHAGSVNREFNELYDCCMTSCTFFAVTAAVPNEMRAVF